MIVSIPDLGSDYLWAESPFLCFIIVCSFDLIVFSVRIHCITSEASMRAKQFLGFNNNRF